MQTDVDKNKQISIALFILLALGVLGLVLGLGSKTEVTKTAPRDEQPSPLPTTVHTNIAEKLNPTPTNVPARQENSNLQTYFNSKYGYKVYFPVDWVKIVGPPEDFEVSNFRKGDFEIHITPMSTSAKTIQEYLRKADAEAQTAWEGTPITKVLSTKLTKIGDYSVVQREEDWLAAGMLKPVVNTYFLINKNIYSVSLQHIGIVDGPNTEMENYRQVLNSFRVSK